MFGKVDIAVVVELVLICAMVTCPCRMSNGHLEGIGSVTSPTVILTASSSEEGCPYP